MSTTHSSRHIRAPRAAVYRALLDPQAVQRWMVPEGMTSTVHSFDHAPGGEFRISLTYDLPTDTGKTDARTDSFHGVFAELVEDTKVVQLIEFETDDPALQGQMTVTYELTDAGDGTEVVGTHDGLPAGVSAADNELGWQMSFAKLARLVEPPHIRDAEVADADALGRIHVRAWQHTYRGVMPDEYLDGLSAEERAEMWRGHLSNADHPPMLVAVAGEEVVGFAIFGAERPGPDSTGAGELYVINLDPSAWGFGIGRALLRAATDGLAAMGFDEALLWVVPQNERARGLYESEGWSVDGGEQSDDVLGVTVAEVRYRRTLSVPAPPET